MYDLLKSLYRQLSKKYQQQGLISAFHSSVWYALRKSTNLTYDQQFKINTNFRYRIQQIQYEAPANPWKLIHVNPKSLALRAYPGSNLRGLGQIKGGNWDQKRDQKFTESVIVKGLKQRFEEGRDWEDTVYYEKVKEDFKQDGSKENYDSLEEFKKVRCAFLDELFCSIKEHGYRPNAEAEHKVPNIDKRSQQTSYYHRLEPIVDIGRDGTIYFREGWHRVTIARILEVERIPVNVMVRHQKWQSIREQIYEAGQKRRLAPKLRGYLGHPDLNDVI